jgi:hypothetical protein
MVLISPATAPSSWAKSCRKLMRETCRLESICARVASLTCPLHRYCSIARPTNTAANAGIATHRRRRSLACGLSMHFQLWVGDARAYHPRRSASLDYKSALCSCHHCVYARTGPQRPFQQRAQLVQEFGLVNHRLGSASGARLQKSGAGVHGHHDDFGSGSHFAK